jgi:hypothetical protein
MSEEMIRPGEFDPIEKPKHYNSHPSGVECVEVAEHMTYNIGNVIKYLWRAGLKEGPEGLDAKEIEDLKKARWYLDREISKRELEKPPPAEAWTEEAPYKSTPWPKGAEACFCVAEVDDSDTGSDHYNTGVTG